MVVFVEPPPIPRKKRWSATNNKGHLVLAALNPFGPWGSPTAWRLFRLLFSVSNNRSDAWTASSKNICYSKQFDKIIIYPAIVIFQHACSISFFFNKCTWASKRMLFIHRTWCPKLPFGGFTVKNNIRTFVHYHGFWVRLWQVSPRGLQAKNWLNNNLKTILWKKMLLQYEKSLLLLL